MQIMRSKGGVLTNNKETFVCQRKDGKLSQCTNPKMWTSLTFFSFYTHKHFRKFVGKVFNYCDFHASQMGPVYLFSVPPSISLTCLQGNRRSGDFFPPRTMEKSMRWRENGTPKQCMKLKLIELIIAYGVEHFQRTVPLQEQNISICKLRTQQFYSISKAYQKVPKCSNT